VWYLLCTTLVSTSVELCLTGSPECRPPPKPQPRWASGPAIAAKWRGRHRLALTRRFRTTDDRRAPGFDALTWEIKLSIPTKPWDGCRVTRAGESPGLARSILSGRGAEGRRTTLRRSRPCQASESRHIGGGDRRHDKGADNQGKRISPGSPALEKLGLTIAVGVLQLPTPMVRTHLRQ